MPVRRAKLSSAEPQAQGPVEILEPSRLFLPAGSLVAFVVLADGDVGGGEVVAGVVEVAT